MKKLVIEHLKKTFDQKVVLEDIDSIQSTGQVKVKGELWSAIADDYIEKDTKIRVVSINGVKLKVEKLKNSSDAKV